MDADANAITEQDAAVDPVSPGDPVEEPPNADVAAAYTCKSHVG